MAAVWSAAASQRSAAQARGTYRPYLAITGNTVEWSGDKATARFYITNSGPAPGRITTQTSLITCPDGSQSKAGMGVTESDVIYPSEKEPVSFTLAVMVGDQVEITLKYEDLPSERSYSFVIAYTIPPSPRPLEIRKRDAT